MPDWYCAVLQEPVDDRTAVLQQHVGRAIAVEVAGAHHLVARGVREHVARLVLPVLQEPVDDRTAVLQQHVGRAIAVEVAGAHDLVARGVGEHVARLVRAVLQEPVDDRAARLQQDVGGAVGVEVARAHDLEARGVGEHVACLVLPVLQRPVDDRAARLQQHVARAVGVEVVGGRISRQRCYCEIARRCERAVGCLDRDCIAVIWCARGIQLRVICNGDHPRVRIDRERAVIGICQRVDHRAPAHVGH